VVDIEIDGDPLGHGDSVIDPLPELDPLGHNDPVPDQEFIDVIVIEEL